MKTNASVRPIPKLLKQLIIISGTLTIIAFIPWDTIFSLELRDDTIAMLMSGTAGLAMLFLFVCFVFILVMQYNNRLLGLAIMMFPMLLVIIVFIGALSIFDPPHWHDEATYKSGDNYLILEGIIYGRDDMITHYRLISTNSPKDSIRHIKIIDTLGTNADRYMGNKIEYNGKSWYKIPAQE